MAFLCGGLEGRHTAEMRANDMAQNPRISYSKMPSPIKKKQKNILPRFRYKAKAVYMQDSFLFFSLFFLFSRFDILSQLTWQIVYVVLVIYSDTWQLTVVSTEWLFLFLIPEKPHSLCSLGFLAAHSADTNSSSSSNFCWWGSTQMYSLFFFFSVNLDLSPI